MTSYTQTFGSPNIVIGIAGIIGAGKSTLCDQLSDILGYDLYKEPVEQNEYLEKFYSNMEQYAFPMQIYMLNHRFRQHQQMVWSNKSAIQDRTIYEDVIFAKLLADSGMISELDFKTYIDLFQNMTNFLHRPNIIIYLDVTPEKSLERIKLRSRDCEKEVPLEYLEKLRDGYESWIKDVETRIPVLRLDWSTFKDPKEVVDRITDFLNVSRGETHPVVSNI